MKKPTRSISGVIVVTLFTKPYPCPGSCIFCPTIKDVPKSYIPSEPACARAITLNYDPYQQIIKRIEVLKNNKHNTDKVEIIISGGTFSSYPKKYLLLFFCRIFEALNLIPPRTDLSSLNISKLKEYLKQQQKINENGKHKSVGISIETRPDCVDIKLIKFWRLLGVTKIQLGVQSMYNKILKVNRRGHTVQQTSNAISLLRQFGFKIQVHYMLNLYKSTPQKDISGFIKMFRPNSICPDELKIYPTSIVDGTKLYNLFRENKYSPYSTENLIAMLTQIKKNIPQYCRVSRVFRDIPSDKIVAGTNKTNLREMVWKHMKEKNLKCECIRCREVRGDKIIEDIKYKTLKYKTGNTKEYFIQAVSRTETKNDCILGFLRLSVGKLNTTEIPNFLKNRAIIREVHVYGVSEKIGESGEIQHTGIGKKLIEIAKELTLKHRYNNLYVISAIGTREYYRKLGFKIDKLNYMNLDLQSF